VVVGLVWAPGHLNLGDSLSPHRSRCQAPSCDGGCLRALSHLPYQSLLICSWGVAHCSAACCTWGLRLLLWWF